MPVIATVEFDDLVATSESTRQTNARHVRFRSSVDHSNFFDRGHPPANEFRHFHFERIRNSEAEAAPCRLADSIDNYFWSMTEDRRPPTADVVDVFFPINVPNLRAFGTRDEERFAFYVAKRADRRVYAARNQLLRLREKLRRTRSHAAKIA